MPYRRNNYDFVIDSSFTPFTMQEMLVPFMAYKDAFEKSEEAYTDLTTKADKFKYLAKNLDPNSEAAKIYNGYANDLKAQAEDLAHNGLSMGNRSALTDLKRRYQGEIGRLEQVDAIRKAQIKEQNALRLQDPTRLFSRRADLTSFDEYLDNPDLSYESYSGALLSQQVGTAAAAIAKSLRDYGKGKPLDGFTKTWLQQHGYTAAEVAMAINDPTNPKSSSVLNSLVDNVVKGSNIASWGDANALSQAYNYARQGLWQAVGQTQVGTYTDEAAKIAAQEASSKRVAQYAAGLTAQNRVTGTEPKFDVRNVRTAKTVAEDKYDRDMWNKYKGYFYKNPKTGNWMMTNKGMKAYAETPNVYKGAYSTALNHGDTDFKTWIDKNGLSEMAKGRTGNYQTSVINNMHNRINNVLDIHRDIEYTRNIGATNYDNVISILNHAAIDGKVTNYERRKTDNGYQYAPKDDKDVSSVAAADIKSAHIVYGKHGDFLEVKLKDGSTVVQPFSALSPTYNAIVQGNKGTISKYIEAKENGIKGIEVMPGQVVGIDDLINSELNSYGDNLISALHFDEVEPVKVSSGYYGTR